MSKVPQTTIIPRRRWETPRVERLTATGAENLYTPTSKDGIYSTS
jgi:hypothetical protein